MTFPRLPWWLEGQVKLGLFPLGLHSGERSSCGRRPSPSLCGSPGTPRPVCICLSSSTSRQTPPLGQGRVRFRTLFFCSLHRGWMRAPRNRLPLLEGSFKNTGGRRQALASEELPKLPGAKAILFCWL